jgi:hypothetical protein
MIAVARRWWMPVSALLALTYLVIMLVAGALPERRHLVRSEANGVLRLAPESITRVTMVAQGMPAVFVREGNGWLREGSAAPVDAPLAETIDRAVKFMHTANPVRRLGPEAIAQAGLAEFGLERPRFSIVLEDAGGVVLEADFGNDSSDGLLQYMRLRDGGELYLMSGFVGKEWQAVAAGGHGDEAQAKRSLMPLPIDEVAAVEIYARGESFRFERDSSGAWLLHRHAPGDDPNVLHRADPAQSARIARALSAFSRTRIERSVADGGQGGGYGVLDPEAIILLFTDDQARAAARLCDRRPRGRSRPLRPHARPHRDRDDPGGSDRQPHGFRRRARALMAPRRVRFESRARPGSPHRLPGKALPAVVELAPLDHHAERHAEPALNRVARSWSRRRLDRCFRLRPQAMASAPPVAPWRGNLDFSGKAARARLQAISKRNAWRGGLP